MSKLQCKTPDCIATKEFSGDLKPRSWMCDRCHAYSFELPELRKFVASVAAMTTTDEGDDETTEETFGLDVSEVVVMAHDNMIHLARALMEDHE